jgi:hypothetical protein
MPIIFFNNRDTPGYSQTAPATVSANISLTNPDLNKWPGGASPDFAEERFGNGSIHFI